MAEKSVNSYFCHEYFRRLALNSDAVLDMVKLGNIYEIENAINKSLVECANEMGIDETVAIEIDFLDIEKDRQVLTIIFGMPRVKYDCYAVGVVFDDSKVYRYLTVEHADDDIDDGIDLLGEWTREGKHLSLEKIGAWCREAAIGEIIEEAEK